MLDTHSCEELYCKKLGKAPSELTPIETYIKNCIIADNTIGRYPKFLMWSEHEYEGFLDWLDQLNVDYTELIDAERWAYEDAFNL